MTPKTGKSTAKYAGTIQVGRCAYNRKYTTITSVTNPTLGVVCRSRFSILLFIFVIVHAVENLLTFLEPRDFQRLRIFYARLFWTRLGLQADIVQNTCFWGVARGSCAEENRETSLSTLLHLSCSSEEKSPGTRLGAYWRTDRR